MKPRLNKSRTFIKVRDKSVTLLEVVVVIALLGMIVLGFSTIELYSRWHVVASDRRAKLQNEVSYIIEHMAKNLGQAIGDFNHPAVGAFSTTLYSGLYARVDGNQNGRLDHDGQDYLILYGYWNNNYQLRYWPRFSGVMPPFDLLSQRISVFNCTYNVANNYVSVNITACWDPAQTRNRCGTQDNPQVTMHANIKMPMVSTR
jgi:hypothetical protein